MSTGTTRIAATADAAEVARLLRAFNAEYDDPAPPQDVLARRVAELIGPDGDTGVVVLEEGGALIGLALLRFRRSLWEPDLEAYLAELYVVPASRGAGRGRRLLTDAMAYAHLRGATYLDLTTTSEDEAALALYESMGFDRHERRGPEVTSYYYETDLPARPGRQGKEAPETPMSPS